MTTILMTAAVSFVCRLSKINMLYLILHIDATQAKLAG